MLKNGSLKDFHVADLINIIGQSQKTGELKVKFHNNESVIYFFNGQLFDAYKENLLGEEVVYELMTYESGDFDFIESDLKIEKRITKNIDELINEGSLRIDLINALRKNSIVSKPSYIIQIRNSSDDLQGNMKNIYEEIEKNISISIIDLAKNINLDIDQYISSLKQLNDKNLINIQKSEEEVFWKSFQQVVNRLYTEFTSISGTKMSTDLDKKIQDLINLDTLNLSFKDGRIYTNELFNFPIEKQWKIYDVFLNKLLDYFVKVYGNDFVEKVLNNLSEDESLEFLLKKLSR